MCGIFGVIQYGAGEPLSDAVVMRARDTMQHRGPDGVGLWRSPDGRATLAHRRLSIIDAAQRVGFTLDEIQDLLGSRYAACSMIGHLLDFNLGLGATVCAGPIRRVSR